VVAVICCSTRRKAWVAAQSPAGPELNPLPACAAPAIAIITIDYCPDP